MIIVRVTQNNATIEQCFRKLIYLHSYLDIKSMISTAVLLKFSIMNYYHCSNVVLVRMSFYSMEKNFVISYVVLVELLYK